MTLMGKLLERLWSPALAFALAAAPTSVSAEPGFHYDARTADVAAHWAARSTLGHAVMFSGMGKQLNLSLNQLDPVFKHAGYVARPAMPDMAMIGAIYAAGSPKFRMSPNYNKLPTLRWNAESFNRTLDPAAQAWTLIKITSPNFHQNFHTTKSDRRVALLMLPQAKALAVALADLKRDDRLFAARGHDGRWSAPKPADQAIALWAISNLILAATSDARDYWHRAYRDLVDADDYRGLAEAAYAAGHRLPPKTAADRALAIEALGRYALATQDPVMRKRAIALARGYADALRDTSSTELTDLALAVYGLVEAGRLFDDRRYADAAARLFSNRILPRWENKTGVFLPLNATGAVGYSPDILGALAAALNAMRWYGPKPLAQKAEAIYPRLLETILVSAGMLQSSPLALVGTSDRKKYPAAVFAHPDLPTPAKAGLAPVFAARVVLDNGRWRVADRRFVTAPAMFLANMLVMRRDGEADAFLPLEGLTVLRVGRQ